MQYHDPRGTWTTLLGPICRALFEALAAACRCHRGTTDLVTTRLRAVAKDFYRNGRIAEAENAYGTILRLAPFDRDSIIGMSTIHIDRGDLPSAIEAAKKLIEVNPDDVHCYLFIVRICFRFDDPPRARECLELARDRGIAQPYLDYMDGLVCRLEDRLEDSAKLLRSSIERSDGFERAEILDALSALSMNLNDLNRKAESIATLIESVRIDPDCVGPYSQLAFHGFYGAAGSGTEHLAHLVSMLDRSDVSKTRHGHAHMVIWQILDSIGRYDEAFEHFRSGNELTRKPFDANGLREYTSQSIEVFDRAFFEKHLGQFDGPKDTPLAFIVGMPLEMSAVKGTHPEHLKRAHLGLQDSRSGQRRQLRFIPTSDSSWPSSTRETGSSRRSSPRCGNDASGDRPAPRSSAPPGRSDSIR